PSVRLARVTSRAATGFMTFPPENACVLFWHRFLQRSASCSCRLLTALGASNPPAQNLLIVTVMSFDRAGIIKHNHHVQTRAAFPPNSARHCPGRPFLCFVCAKRKDSFACSSCAAGLRADFALAPCPMM